MVNENSLAAALRDFDATEANLAKLERLASEIRSLVPDGIVFGRNLAYDQKCWAFDDILEALPAIDGWKPEVEFYDLNQIAQERIDAHEIDEYSILVGQEEGLDAPATAIADYRHRFNRKRRRLVRDAIRESVEAIDRLIGSLRGHMALTPDQKIEDTQWQELADRVQELDTLLGSAAPRAKRWDLFRRHVHFGWVSDLKDIELRDWPDVKRQVLAENYGEDEPIPVSARDLGELVARKPSGPIATKLAWDTLSAEEFERLVFNLISGASGYDNPEWLMSTNAPDRGRDLSAYRTVNDSLGGVQRHRAIIQCRHWLSRSVSDADIATLRTQMTHWEPPRVDVLIVATSGRFTSDAVDTIERHNTGNNALRIEMWAESHLEMLLARRPDLVGEFRLR
jgi:hypothetical protein